MPSSDLDAWLAYFKLLGEIEKDISSDDKGT